MKTRSLTNLSLVLALSALPFVGGCTQSNATSAEPGLTNVPPAGATTAGDNNPGPAPTETAAALPVPSAEPALPPNILPATPLAKVIKLAQSGVDENVMLTFVTNSVKPFNLDSEEIVYLNDIGVPSTVITTMMQHDQGLKLSGANLAQAAAPKPEPVVTPEPEPIAAAPSYVNAPAAASGAEAQPPIVANNYFYDSLAPYGNWIQIEGYGRCWQPTVVVGNRNWQPYGDRGRWIYTDAGWYWLSDYSWGATTFHYGRWFSDPSRGWCWWPDTVWAPSWVNWRYSGTYCGWAPLPPAACYQAGFGFTYYGSSVGIGFGFGLAASCYTFVPWGGFCAARPYQYRVPGNQVTQIYNNTTIINNYGSGNNNTVINRGIAVDRVRQYTHTEVRTVNLRDQAVAGSRNERVAQDGRTLAVHRPALTPLKGSSEVRMDTPVRSGSPRANQRTVSGIPQNAANNPIARSGRGEAGIERSRANGNSGAAQITSPVASGISTTIENRAPAVRVEPLPSRDPQPWVVGNSVNPGRASLPGAGLPSGVSPAPATASAPRVNQPRVIQVSPQNTTRNTVSPAGSLVVIGGKGATRSSSGRDYSVWNTPSPAPTASAPASSPRNGVPSRSVPSSGISSSSDTEYASAPVSRVQSERAVTSRGSYSAFSTPPPSGPSAASRSEVGRPAPSYVSQPASPSPVSSGQRFEAPSAPAPAGPASSPTRPQSGPVASPGQRSR